MFLFLLACNFNKKPTYPDETKEQEDLDGDGYIITEDCDDSDSNIFPNQTEICDGIDNNCDNRIDEGVLIDFFADIDQDGFGGGLPIQSCEQPPNTVNNNTDCDDNNPNIFPYAEEICDGVDNNCDAHIDEELQIIAYRDEDEDGFGDAHHSTFVCVYDDIYVQDNTDCDDNNNTIYPNAHEFCDQLDNNCNGFVDEGATFSFYEDSDEDGFGNPSVEQKSCSVPLGFVDNFDDCNDEDASVHPNSTEICDNIDNNCNGYIDMYDVFDGDIIYQDADFDGFGSPYENTTACFLPTGYSWNADDCDDTHLNINPSVMEMCDGVDNNCNGQIDEPSAMNTTFYYIDNDGDGFGATQVQSCHFESNYSYIAGDCDDTNSNIHPLMDESCDGIDNDCDDEVDEADAIGALQLYTDHDGDGFGNSYSFFSCFEEDGSLQNGDCVDNNPNIHPMADEICDGVDNNCNGHIDDNPTDGKQKYRDEDADGYGDPEFVSVQCSFSVEEEFLYVDNSLDCDDEDPLFFTNQIYYLDEDNDGFGQFAIPECTYEQWILNGMDVTSYIEIDGDCDDNNDNIHPNADEICDSIDNNCNDLIDDNPTDGFAAFEDLDNDGYGSMENAIYTCDIGVEGVLNNLDCDDTDASVHVLAEELCSGVDKNCDGFDPILCTNCLEIHINHPEYESGVYAIFDWNLGMEEVFCDMETEGGGWTLVQRSLWDWSKTQNLMTDYDSWYYESQNTPHEDDAWRLEGRFWNSVLVEGEHMFKHVARDVSGQDCDALYYLEGNIAMNIDSNAASISNASYLFVLGDSLLTTDNTSSCVNNGQAIPFFYSNCCSACPSYRGNYWSDTPHPMVSYLDNIPDIYGQSIFDVCPNNLSISSNDFEGVNRMEYYLR